MNVAVGGTGYFPDDVSFFYIFIILIKCNIKCRQFISFVYQKALKPTSNDSISTAI